MPTPDHILERRSALAAAIGALRCLDWVARAKEIHTAVLHLTTMERKTMADMPINLRWRTPQYSALRQRAFKRDRFRCTACGHGPGDLRMHHLSYDRVGTDQEILDVVTLCERCHADRHPADKRRRYHLSDQLGIDLDEAA